MVISHIVAASENNVIGVDNRLPWKIPEDTQFFREKTKGHAIVMGRKTYESLGKPLSHRLNVVISRQKNLDLPGAHVAPSLHAALEICRSHTDIYGDEVYIIGGGEIYQSSMDIVDVIYLTRVHKQFPGDAKYPEVDLEIFEEIERRERPGDPAYTFLTYRRRSRK